MKTSDFYFELPKELIAQDPLENRAASRLLTLDRNTGDVQHKVFSDIVDLLNPGDCLVLNDTKVIPARLLGVKKDTGAMVEVFLLKRLSEDTWETLVKPGKKLKPGAKVCFGGMSSDGGALENGCSEDILSDDEVLNDALLSCEILDTTDDGGRIVRFFFDGIFEEVLDKLGEMPLPPYITHKLKDKDRYQTVYAKNTGSVAAPTAGLHFTKELLDKIAGKGVEIAYVTLHVGLGTFRPVKAEDITDHHMHSESYVISLDAAEKINRVKRAGGRIICVGTTSVRTLESAAGIACSDSPDLPDASATFVSDGTFTPIMPCEGDTEIFIYPGYEFKVVDAIITNFHLPESTLVMLVSAFAGREHVLNAYAKAIEEKYRFFSFGDAMYIY